VSSLRPEKFVKYSYSAINSSEKSTNSTKQKVSAQESSFVALVYFVHACCGAVMR